MATAGPRPSGGPRSGEEPEPVVDRALRQARFRLLVETLWPHRGLLGLAMGCIVVSTVASVAMPQLIRRGIDRGVVPRRADELAWTLALFLVAAAVDFFASRAGVRVAGRVAEAALFDLRLRLWRHLQSLSLDFFERSPAGRVIARVTGDVEAVYELFSGAALTVGSNLLLVAAVAIAMLALDAVLAAVVLALVPVAALTSWVYKRRSERAYRVVREKIALVMVRLTETLGAVRVVQAFSRERESKARFDDVNRQHLEASGETVLLFSMYGPGLELFGYVALAAVLLVGGGRAVDGQVTIGVLTAFVLYSRQFFEPLQELSHFQNDLQAASAGLEKIAAVLGSEPRVAEHPDAHPLPPGGGTMRFEQVTFGYSSTPVLHSVDLTLEAGSTLALIGPTGAGKSTVAKLAARFYDPDEGRVLLDGQDLRSVTIASLRQAVALVPQEPFLFSGTVADNIAFGRPGAERSDIEAAVRAVGASALLERLPGGLDTDISARGHRLSAGERQLVSFARAWLVQARLLILDEATSALDLATERLVQESFRHLLASRTALVIAHRFSSVEVADEVAVLERGRVVEYGTPRDLLRSDTRFRALRRRWESTVA